MIVRGVRLLRGIVTFCAESAMAEQLIATCAKQNIPLDEITPSETGFIGECSPRAFLRVKECAEECNVSVKKVNERGGSVWMKTHRWRAVLFACICAAVGLLYLSQCFVFRIDISGNQQVTDEAILTVLKEVGIDTFSFIPGTYFKMVREQVLLKLPALSWMTVNPHGCRLEVVVAERRIATDIEDQKTPCDIRASCDGIIRNMEVYAGKETTSAGHVVEEGEILVHGHYHTENNEEVLTHAKAKVIAEVWFDKTLRIDLNELAKEYTDEITEIPYLRLFTFRIPLSFTAKPEGTYDTSWKEQPFTLWGREFPFGIDTLTCSPYETISDEAKLEEMACEILEKQFSQLEATEYADFAIIERESRMRKNGTFMEMTVSYIAETDIAQDSTVQMQEKPKEETP